MFYVYLIRSLKYPETTYVGYTTNLKQRLETHNSGGPVHTAQYRPWELHIFLGFKTATQAKAFESYLKSQTGRAFAKKRLW
ncbi:MAG TPA: GIY-YIG nuclease family protein [Candidatus Babeliales bacterium]|nr:GIY-YIG nuclease family protein [Candidatus Babeliales bacterium]